jgi:hypothetical protein
MRSLQQDSTQLSLFDTSPQTEEDAAHSAVETRGFSTIRDYYEAWFQFVRSLHAFRERVQENYPLGSLDIKGASCHDRVRKQNQSNHDDHARELEDLIKRSSVRPDRYPLERMCEALALDNNQRLIVVFTLMRELSGDRAEIHDLRTLMAEDSLDMKWKHYLLPTSALLIEDVLRIEDGRRCSGLSMRSEVRLRPAVRDWLLTGRGNPLATSQTIGNNEPFSSNEDFLAAWLRYITKRIQLAGGDERFTADDDAPSYELISSSQSSAATEYLERLSAAISERTESSRKEYPLQKLLREHNLTSAEERDVLLLLVDSHICQRGIFTSQISRILGSDLASETDVLKLLSASSKLVRDGLIELAQSRFGRVEVSITPRTFDFIMGRTDEKTFSVEEMVADDPILSLIRPVHTLDDLVLPEGILERLRDFIGLQNNDSNEILRQWGVLPPSLSEKETGVQGGRILMLHGASGTGKSLCAEALAGTLRRDILTTDISKILSYWVGESEANVSRLFDRYEFIASRMEAQPILIIDECDQLLGKRFSNPERSVDKMMNGLQSLLLERMSSFQGLMILTTNLVDDGAFDPAYNRRIHAKIRFPFPTVEMRIALWRLHLKPSIPLDDDVDIERLARDHSLTGGQIRIIVENAVAICVVRHKRDRLMMSDIEEAVVAEEQGSLDSSAQARIRSVGFCVESEPRLKVPVHSGR